MDELRDIGEQLLRTSPDALIVVDGSAHIRFANDTVREIFGHAPEALIGQPLDVLIPQRLRARHGVHVAQYLLNPRNREMGARAVDLFALRADGSEFPAAIRIAPCQVGGQMFFAAAVRDSTESALVRDELMAARKEADRANAAKSWFLATASHDLRQPIQTLRLLHAVMMRVVSQAQVRDLLQQSGEAIEGMTRLLNALLDISRLESGAVQPVITTVSLADVFEELRAEFLPVAQSRGIELQIDAVGIAVSTDRTLFHQLLQNLVGNALKYTDRGRVEVRCVAGADSIVLTVEDTGIGIPADRLDRIFDDYFQVEPGGNRRGGVGLGLAIVNKVAGLLGFAIELHSTVGKGTQAVVSIPARCRVAESDSVADRGIGPRPSQSGRKVRLMLAEGNDGVRFAAELFLHHEGYETIAIRSLEDVAAVSRKLRPDDVLIADHRLDGKETGFDLLARLRAVSGREVPGIVLSDDPPSALRSIEMPIPNCRLLSKPVDSAALLEAIAALTEGSGEQHRRPVQLAGTQAL